MKKIIFVYVISIAISSIFAVISEQIIEADVDLSTKTDVGNNKKKRPEDSIPVIEISGEGKPMTAAQIRALEGGDKLDIKITKTWRPTTCPRAAKRKDFVTFHYKAFTEDGRKYDQSYGRGDPIRMQLGVGMTMPGLDKGMRGMCNTELRKLSIPYRLSRKKKSKVWKNILNDEHWLVFDIEMINVEPWSMELQFAYFDLNNDSMLTATELVKYQEKIRKEFGKTWSNEDIDNVHAAKYFIRYFDVNGDDKIDLSEYKSITRRDQTISETTKKSTNDVGRKRDPGIAWIVDLNNDGIVTLNEWKQAADVFEKGETILKPIVKDEL